MGVFLNEKVTKLLKHLGDRESFHLVYESLFKEQVDGGLEFSLLQLLHDFLSMLFGVKQIVPARSECIHHHLVQLLVGILSLNRNWIVLQVLWRLNFFFGLRRCLGSLRSRSLLVVMLIVCSLLALASQDSRQFNLFVLENMHEDHSSHVSIVSSLVIVRQQSRSLIVATSTLSVILASQIALEFVVIRAFLIHLTQARIVKSL